MREAFDCELAPTHLIVVALVLHSVEEAAHGRSPLVQRGRNNRGIHWQSVEIEADAWNERFWSEIVRKG